MDYILLIIIQEMTGKSFLVSAQRLENGAIGI